MRRNTDKMKTADRASRPFVVRIKGPGGDDRLLAAAVIDASGTYQSPNPLGAHGLPALGERAVAHRVAYGIPDILGKGRNTYADKHVLVVGSGHSAFNALLDMEALSWKAPDTRITWAIRRDASHAAPGSRTVGPRAARSSDRGANGSHTHDNPGRAQQRGMFLLHFDARPAEVAEAVQR